MEEAGVLTNGERRALRIAAHDLQVEFRGVFGEETIESLLLSSYRELAANATVTRWLVLGAQHFTRQRLKEFVQAEKPGVPSVLFLCVHNAGRSQMALGYFNQLAGSRAVAWSGGSEPASEVNASAVAGYDRGWHRHLAGVSEALGG